MEINKILSSDLLDIIFEGRNKAYGAYDLRKTYNRRMIKATFGTIGIISLVISCYAFTNKFSKDPMTVQAVVDLTPEFLKPVEEQPAVVPPPKAGEPPKIKSIQNVVPLIVKDELFPEIEAPPAIEDLADARIGKITTDGLADDLTTAPPVIEDKRGIIMPPKTDDYNPGKIFYKVEIESIYPGGSSAWMRYLNKTFRYPTEAQEESLQGTVTVQFIVDVDGNVSNVEAISGPENGGLREEAIRVIKKSGKWEPAIQNGNKVKSYKKQPITFKLEM